MKKKTALKIFGFISLVGAVSSCTLFETSSKESTSGSSQTITYRYFKEPTRYTMYDLNVCREQQSLAPVGDKKILVLPITIKGYEYNATEATRENIRKTFFGEPNETAWNSVSSFYSKSSYQAFNLEGEVAPWYDSKLTPAEIAAMGDEDQAIGVIKVMNDAVEAYRASSGSDLSEYDYDKDGFIDGIWMIYSCPNYSNMPSLPHTSFWAYTFWDIHAKADPAKPTPKAFCWASYDFMYDGYGSIGNKCLDAHTYIHETGHLFGLEDYYDYNGKCAPMGGIDMMDYNIIDHNAFSKYLFGWVEPFIIEDEGSLYLKPSSSTGECALIPTKSHWNGSVFDEYLLLEYYTPTDLNLKDSTLRYKNCPLGFTENGVRIYHVDARLCKMPFYGSRVKTEYVDDIVKETDMVDNYYTNIAHTNTPTSDRGQTRNHMNEQYRLVQEMDCTKRRNFANQKSYSLTADNSTLFQKGDIFTFEKYASSFPNGTTMNDGTTFDWEITIGNMTNDGVEITFTEI
ncbi:MAG: hypothetical protein MJ220_01275 [Bacilli bacterium]|nr:hypothetical protein [Bacilli bacterium]